MRKIDALLHEYGLSHQNQTNKTIHWICVPAIFFSIVGLIFSIPAGILENFLPFLESFANWATITLIIILFYYVSISPPLALGMFFFSAICLALANFIYLISPIPLWVISIAIFIAAWIFQFYGHKIEGKKPSFLKDIQFLLIGPAWLMSFIYKRFGFAY
ncbi:putative membrane protein [Belliella baltica DSM 15883]|uniref:Putative membrane protein n=1 Tax=Belliella baltica (strain DSM 15883 / CIP 108006 / LMG 21964 / BA134) TaxID=866536 RepID=I3Z0N7_BELBD|nr:Mpo1-like protein [Belliella baltica]AFL82805.1 putative membrane protein [Belliella baltica DSM 15883]